MIALFIVVVLAVDGAWRPAFVVIFLIWFIPWITYTRLRSPVLESLWRNWPPFMDEWFKGLAEDLAVCKGLCHILQYCRYFPPFCEKWDAVYWSPQGNARDSLLRAAINEMFRADSGKEILWRHKAFIRWIFYWCTPIWGSYITLLFLLIPEAYNNKFSEQWIPKKGTLYFLVWTWIIFGVIFILREAAELNRWSWLDKDNRDYVPPLIYRHLKDISGDFMILSEVSIKLAFSLIGAAGVSVYLSLVNVVYPTTVKVPEPIEIKSPDKSHKEVTNNTVITKKFHLQ